jgi:hypothetical protein
MLLYCQGLVIIDLFGLSPWLSDVAKQGSGLVKRFAFGLLRLCRNGGRIDY